jgi:hypothetical protein
MTDLETLAARVEAAEAEAIFFPRISDVELTELVTSNPPLARRCSGCAYTPGTEAHSTPTTAMSRDTCDRTGHPFWCHMHRDRLAMPVHLCVGWIEARALPTPPIEGEG